jgi:uncharacterized coiled-coil DUF342 family protein
MLNELDLLSQNIGRLISISDGYQQARHELEQQLAQARAERDATRAEAEQIRHERDLLREERDVLSAKIDDAQVRLNAILEKLPHNKAAENQLDLLAAAQDQENAAENTGGSA